MPLAQCGGTVATFDVTRALAAWLRRAGVVLLGIAMATPAPGQQWRIRSSAELELRCDDNIGLDAENPRSGIGSSAAGALRSEWSSERAHVDLFAGLSLSEFADQADFNNYAAVIGFDGAYQTPRSSFGLLTSLSTESTLSSETATTGRTDADGQQYRFALGPSWRYRVDERTDIGLAASFLDVSYEDTRGSGLSDYRSGLIAANARHRLTEITDIYIGAQFGRFEASEIDADADNLAMEIGADYRASESLDLGLALGLSDTRLQGAGLGAGAGGTTPVFRLTLAKAMARGGGLRLSAQREVVPSGAARVLDTTSLNLGFSHPIDERLAIELTSSAYRNRGVGDDQRTRERTYAAARVGLAYRLSPTLSLAIGYRHRWQDEDGEPGSAHANEVALSLRWTGR
jgi:hypothetical protein